MLYKKQTTYVAKPVEADGTSIYTAEENQIWHELIERQIPLVQNFACEEYLHGIELLNLPHDRIPQCPEISAVLQEATGWSLEPVPALIPFDKFFYLLANRKFPAATFIRRRAEMDYLQEPDIFHEIFGHCPLLTNPAYADFTHTYGKLGLNASHKERVLLARLYWFTIEFGLIKTAKGLRAYGGGILSSKNETSICLDNSNTEHKIFNVLEAFRTPYRIDIMQPIYFVLEDFATLYQVIEMDLLSLIRKALELGEYSPTFTKE